jgi:DNA-binding PadR family transcriptional regulator
MKSGNAYSLWKQSTLKHYPTVLRTLKKLKEKNFVEILSKDGVRGETIYGVTVQGSFVFYIVRNEEQELLGFLSSNSRLFHELYEVNPDKTLIYEIIRGFPWSGKSEKVSIDKVVKEEMESYVDDRISNILNEPEARTELRMMSRVGWIKSLIIEETQRLMDSWKRELEAFTKLKKEMEKAKE